MKLDKAIKNFTEKYDRTAMEYVEKVSSDFGLITSRQSIPSFNIKAAFEKFTEYLEGYTDYMIRVNNEKVHKLTDEKIMETTKTWCDKLFESDEVTKDSDLRYNQIPTFIESYITGVKNLITAVESNKSRLMYEDIDLASVGSINDYSDIFMDRLDAKFESVMDKILLASGYTTAQKLAPQAKTTREAQAYFL